MKVFIGIISHGHADLIKELGTAAHLANNFKVVLKNNVNENLTLYCGNNNIELIEADKGKGFGENNNLIFDYCLKNLNMDLDKDHFIVLNPDVQISVDSINALIKKCNEDLSHLAAINLIKPNGEYDYSVRDYPKLTDFINSFLTLSNKTKLDKSLVKTPISADWAAGSFLLFKASLYNKLGGFDSDYFMYCEDIDICWRARKLFSRMLTYYPDINAIHHAQHANRSVLSKHFMWHIKSMVRYLIMFYGFRKPYKPK